MTLEFDTIYHNFAVFYMSFRLQLSVGGGPGTLS